MPLSQPAEASPPPVDVLVLAGGRGSRMGGQDKAALVVDGQTLLERLLAVDLGGGVVVVGPTPLPPVDRPVLQTVEDPPGGGPVAGIAAGLAALTGCGSQGPAQPEWVAVVAVDQPGAAAALSHLRAAIVHAPAHAEVLGHTDPAGRRQWLLAIYRRAALERALGALEEISGAAVRQVVGGLAWHEVAAGAEHVGDLDTWDDVEAWRRR